ncbi:MAG TPA: O-antigen ligase family protein [Bryobacteraceae bacterium]|nr:O-antigen ligase family protein [Bryobacteraceae bacterium]
MHILLAAILFLAILTLWVPAFWPVAVFEAGVLVLAGVALVRFRHRLPVFSWPIVPLSGAALWGSLQLLTGRSIYAFDTRNAVVEWTTFAAVYFLGLCLFRSADAARWFRSALLWFTFLLSSAAILQVFTAPGRIFWLFQSHADEIVMGPFLYRNNYAAFVEAILPMAMYEALHRSRTTLLHALMAAAMFASVVASASRAGLVLASAEIILVPLLVWQRRRHEDVSIGWPLLAAGVMLAVGTVAVGPQSVWVRFQDSDPYAIRRRLAVSTLHMVRAHLIVGTGLGTWSTAYPGFAIADFGRFANRAHNDWLQWAAEGGLPLALLLVSVFFWSVRPAVRSIWGIGVIAVFLHATVDYPFARPALGSWVWLVLALIAADAARGAA